MVGVGRDGGNRRPGVGDARQLWARHRDVLGIRSVAVVVGVSARFVRGRALVRADRAENLVEPLVEHSGKRDGITLGTRGCRGDHAHHVAASPCRQGDDGRPVLSRCGHTLDAQVGLPVTHLDRAGAGGVRQGREGAPALPRAESPHLQPAAGAVRAAELAAAGDGRGCRRRQVLGTSVAERQAEGALLDGRGSPAVPEGARRARQGGGQGRAGRRQDCRRRGGRGLPFPDGPAVPAMGEEGHAGVGQDAGDQQVQPEDDGDREGQEAAGRLHILPSVGAQTP